MEKANWVMSMITVVISAITAAGVLWNAIQINGIDSKVDELRGKVDTIETILEGHVNRPDLHSESLSREQDLSAAR